MTEYINTISATDWTPHPLWYESKNELATHLANSLTFSFISGCTAIRCPYCREIIYGPHHQAGVYPPGGSFSYHYTTSLNLLNHIEGHHPDIPLTKPACWVVVVNPAVAMTYYRITIGDRETVSWNKAATPPGTYHVTITRIVRRFHPPIPALLDQDVTFDDWGAKLIYNEATNEWSLS